MALVSPGAVSSPAAPVTETLLDRLMPGFDFGSRYALVVAAPAARVADAAETCRLDASPVVRLLFWLRGLGAAPGTLRASLAAEGFALLAEEPGEEVVLGTAGRFWTLDERAHMIRLPDTRAFADFHQPGCAKAAVNIRFEPLSPTTTRLSTETRVQCVDGAAYRRFALYWAAIRPFSAWIRREMLRGIQRAAEGPGAAALPGPLGHRP